MNTLAPQPVITPRRTESAQRPRSAPSLLPLLLLFAGLKVGVQIVITLLSEHAGYGIFRDELYYLVCGHRLAFGYVDQPPLVALQARLAELLFGYQHLVAFRLLPYLAGALTVVLTGLLASALGGGRRAAALAMFAVLTAPVFLATHSFLSMNAWEPVFWMGVALALVRVLAAPGATRWWLVLGASAGLALENKASAIFLIAALLVSLLVTPARTLLLRRGFFLACAVCALLAMPNLLWQATHGFPTWEWLQDVQHSTKDVVLSPPQFLVEQVFMLSPLHVLFWLPGVVWLLAARESRRWRAAGFLYLFVLLIMGALHAKDYYVAPIYPLLFAAGAVFWMEWAGRSQTRQGVIAGYAGLALLFSTVTLPFAVPVLAPAAYLHSAQSWGFQPVESEQHPGATFPEFFADHLQWPSLAAAVSRVYHALPLDEQRGTGIFAGNYGQASALTILGAPLGLPPAISGHQNFWLWGPGSYTGKEMIVVTSDSLAQMRRVYRSCTIADRQTSPYTMPWEQRNIYVCHDRFQPYATSWNDVKIYR